MSRRSLARTGTFQPGTAPGELRLLQDFANTLDLERGTDALSGPGALADWLVGRQLLAPGTGLDEADWRQALEIRQLLRRQCRLHHGSKANDLPLGPLSQVLGQAPVLLSLSEDSEMRFEVNASGWPGVVARFVITITEAIQAKQWTRLKACHSDTCQWIFYDASRNRKAKWCSVQRCGNWTNSATYRRRGATWRRKKG